MSHSKAVHGLHHVALKVRDFDRTVGFYHGVLGLEVRHAWSNGELRVVMMEIGGGNFLEVFETAEGEPTEGKFIHLAFATTDVSAAIEKVRAWGCEITVEPRKCQAPATPPIFGRNAFFKGPDGEVIEVFEPGLEA